LPFLGSIVNLLNPKFKIKDLTPGLYISKPNYVNFRRFWYYLLKRSHIIYFPLP